MDDDDFESIDFSAIDKIVENHQARLQGSQAAPVSPHGKAPTAGTAAHTAAALPSRQPFAAPQQQQQHWQRQSQPHGQPVSAVPGTSGRPNHQNGQAQQQADAQYHSQQAGHTLRPGIPQGRQQLPSQQSVYKGPRSTAAYHSTAPVGRISQAANLALGQQQQQQQSQLERTGAPAVSHGPGDQQQLAQLQAERDTLQQRLNQEQGTNAVLRSNLERKERERDDLKRRMQQMSSQPSGLSSFNMAEAQKQVATLTQQLAFKEQEIQDLKRRCAEKDQAVRPLEEEVQHLQQERQRIEKELEEANRDRRERGAGASTSFEAASALPHGNSPSPSKVRKPSSAAASGAKGARSSGIKRKLATVLGSPSSMSGGNGGPLQNCHAPLPLQSVVNGQMSSRDPQGGPARRSAVAQSKGLAQTAPTSTPQEIPACERTSWSRPHSSSISTSALQQLWLNCPDSFSRLLTPQPLPTQSIQTQIKRVSTSLSSLDSQQSLSAATAKLTCAVQQDVQMLACGNSTASVAMLHDLTSFLKGYQMHTRAACDPSSTLSADAQKQLSQQGSHPPAGDASAAYAEASDTVVSAALQVAAVLIAHDQACQQAVIKSLNPSKTQAGALSKEAQAACLSLGDLQLSTRLSIKFGGDGGKTDSLLLKRTHTKTRQQVNKAHTKPLPVLLLQLCQASFSCPMIVQSALACLLAVVAVLPVNARGACTDIVTSGMLEQLLGSQQHNQQALQLLHLLTQSSAVCQILTDGLGDGFQPDSEKATVHSQADGNSTVGQQQRQQRQLQGAGDSAEAPMEIDADDVDSDDKHSARWTRTAELLDALVACLNIPTTTVTPPDTSPNHPPTPRQPPPYTAQHPSAAPLSLSHTKATTVHRANSVRWGLHKTQRLALLVIATLMQQHQSRLMAHLVQGGETIREGGLSQCLLTMVESVSRDDSGSLLSAFTSHPDPQALSLVRNTMLNTNDAASSSARGHAASASDLKGAANGLAARALAAPQTAAAASSSLAAGDAAIRSDAASTEPHLSGTDAHVWHENVRLAQEALTLLRCILTDSLLGRASIEDLVSSSSAIRLSLITTTRLSRVQAESCKKLHCQSYPLALQQWVTAWGSSSSSSAKSINSHSDCRGGVMCSSIEDVAYMAKSLRQRVLVQLNHMSS